MGTKGCDTDKLTYAIIGTALRVHSRIGPGCTEHLYRRVMFRSLAKQGLFVETEKRIGFEFDGEWFEEALRADLVVERQVIVEIKSQRTLTPLNQQQILSYMRMADIKVGLLSISVNCTFAMASSGYLTTTPHRLLRLLRNLRY